MSLPVPALKSAAFPETFTPPSGDLHVFAFCNQCLACSVSYASMNGPAIATNELGRSKVWVPEIPEILILMFFSFPTLDPPPPLTDSPAPYPCPAPLPAAHLHFVSAPCLLCCRSLPLASKSASGTPAHCSALCTPCPPPVALVCCGG